MRSKLAFCFLITAAIILSTCISIGCGQSANVDKQTATNTFSPQAETVGAAATPEGNHTKSVSDSIGVCSNKYYPVADGAVRRYEMKNNGTTDEVTYTQTFKVAATGFVVVQALKSHENINVVWDCLPDGLRTTTFAELSGIKIAGMELESKNPTGLTLPKDSDWSAGRSWQSAYPLTGSLDMKVVKGAITGDVVLDSEIVAMDEKIIVAAGEFSAAKVKTNISINTSFQGRKLPTKNLVMTNWFAAGTGLVKQDVTDNLGTSSMDLLELK